MAAPDLAELTIIMDSRGVVRAKDRLGKFVSTGQRAQGATNDLRRQFGRMTGGLKPLIRNIGLLAGGLGTVALAAKGVQTAFGGLRTIREFEVGLVGVGKTTNLLGEELQAVGQDIINLSTAVPIGTRRLLEIGQAAGQLGVTGRKNILLFTETIAKLGTATDLAGEQAAITLARLLAVTGEATSNVGVLGSVLVALGNQSAASEAEIAQVAERVAQSTVEFGLASTEIVALSAAMKEVGLRAEQSGSAIGRTFRAISAAIREGGEAGVRLTQITGKSIQELERMRETDPLGLFIEFVRGLRAASDAGTETSVVLEDFGLQGQRLLQVIPPLVQRFEVLESKLGILRTELVSTNALNEEAARAFQTLDARIKIFGNVIDAAFLKLSNSTGVLSEFVDFASQVVAELAGIELQGTKVSKTAETVAKSIEAITAAVAAFLAVSLATKLAGLAAGFVSVSRAVKLLTVALATNPIGLIAVAISSAVAAIVFFRDELITIKGTTATVMEFVVAAFQVLKERAIGNIEAIASIISRVFNFMKRVASLTFKIIGTGFEAIKDTVTAFFNALLGLFGTSTGRISIAFQAILETAVESFSGMFDAGKSAVNKIIGFFVALGKSAATVFGRILDAMKAIAKFDVTKPFETGKEAVKALQKALNPKTALEEMGDAFSDAFGKKYIDIAFDGGRAAVDAFIEGFKIIKEKLANDPDLKKLFEGLDLTTLGQDIADRAATLAFQRNQGQLTDISGQPLVGPRSLGPTEEQLAQTQAPDRFQTLGGGVPLLGVGRSSAGPEGDDFKRLQESQTATQAPDIIRATGTDSETQKFFEELDRERELLGRVSEERERANKLREFEEAARKEFVGDQEKINAKVAEFKDKLIELGEAERLAEIADRIGSAFGDALSNIIFEAESVEDAFKQMARVVIRQIIEIAAIQPLVQGLTGGLTTAFVASANGNAFDRNGVMAFANGGVVNQPTLFPFANGTGLMGEAGPEAILPLSRDSSGKLGVRSEGGQQPVNVTINVNARDADSFKRSETQIAASMARGIRKAQRP